MQLKAVVVFLTYFVLEATSSKLHCLSYHRKLRARMRNPKHAQMIRCCGDSPYSSSSHTCCHDDTVAELCREWSSWQPWSPCSATCGGGERFRNRSCAEGRGCPLDGVQVEQCGDVECEEEFIECQSCIPSLSNDECNNYNQTCNVIDGEGCQNIVRKENSKIFVEKRCKQLQACHTEARLQVMQGVCDPQSDISLCLYCCEGTNCNKNLEWKQPTWYRQEWIEWLGKLAAYSQLIQNKKASERKSETFESFVARNRSKADEPFAGTRPGKLREYHGKMGDKELDALFIGAILNVEKLGLKDDPTSFLLAMLHERLPGDYPRPRSMVGFSAMR